MSAGQSSLRVGSVLGDWGARWWLAMRVTAYGSPIARPLTCRLPVLVTRPAQMLGFSWNGQLCSAALHSCRGAALSRRARRGGTGGDGVAEGSSGIVQARLAQISATKSGAKVDCKSSARLQELAQDWEMRWTQRSWSRGCAASARI